MRNHLDRLLALRPDGIFVAPFEQGEIGPDLFRKACEFGLEGLVSKRRDRPYQAGRSKHWVKVKNRKHPAMSRVMEGGIAMNWKEQMVRLLLATAMSVALIGSTQASTYTYMCRDHNKSYPVVLDTGSKDDCDGESCTIKWRGTTFRNVKMGGGCRYNYFTTDNGVKVDLCTATQGVADLTIGNAKFDCQMRRDLYRP
jgi:bifunctional non-homologous end joining protein LigD